MKCPKCGAENKGDRQFCYLCFHEFEPDKKSPKAKKSSSKSENKTKKEAEEKTREQTKKEVEEETGEDRASGKKEASLDEPLLASSQRETKRVVAIPVVILLVFGLTIGVAGVSGYYLGLKVGRETSGKAQRETGEAPKATEKAPSGTQPAPSQLTPPGGPQESTEQDQEQACQDNLEAISRAVEVFYTKNNYYPSSLSELKQRGYIDVETKCPASGANYDYDSSTGKVACPSGHTPQ